MRRWVVMAFVVAFVACDKGPAGTGSNGSAAAPGSGSAAALAQTVTAPTVHTATPPAATPPAAAPAAPAAPPAPPATKPFVVGDRIQGRWSDGRWYNGKIAAVNGDGTYDIHYDDGDKSSHLAAARVRVRGAAPVGGSSSASSNSAPCPGPGLTRRCNGVCVNIQEDDNNCGSCGTRCSGGKHCDGHMFCRDASGAL